MVSKKQQQNIIENVKSILANDFDLSFNVDNKTGNINILVKDKNQLPTSWKEWFETLEDGTEVYYTNAFSEIHSDVKSELLSIGSYENISLTRESTEAHLAMIQLENLKNAYNDSVGDNYEKTYFATTDIECNYVIENIMGVLVVSKKDKTCNRFLSFKTKELAEKFLENFRPLIETAKHLI